MSQSLDLPDVRIINGPAAALPGAIGPGVMSQFAAGLQTAAQALPVAEKAVETVETVSKDIAKHRALLDGVLSELTQLSLVVAQAIGSVQDKITQLPEALKADVARAVERFHSAF
jgi:ABC-type transporter Mla subunit MlaD